MSLAGRIVQIINAGLIRFISILTLTNRDYPYHDYYSLEDGSEPDTYIVGKTQKDNKGDQHKLFTSKSTLLIATTETTIKLNHSENVTQTLLANVPYFFETNIRSLYVITIGAGGVLYAYFEGVLPNEARRPE